MWEDNKNDKYAVTINFSNIQKEDAHIKRDIKDKIRLFSLMYHVWHLLNVY